MTDVAAVTSSFLDEQALNEWIVAQRWFASKTREVSQIDDRRLRAAAHRAAAARAVPGRGALPGRHARDLPGAARRCGRPREGWSERVIFEADGWTVYDALADPAAGRELLHRMRSNAEFQAGQDEFIFRWAPSAGAGLGGTVDVRPVGVEQSNSSIVFGDELIMKAFRRVEPGVNPELELLRFLTAARLPAHRLAGGLVRGRGAPDRRDARDPAGVPGRRPRRLGARARRAGERPGAACSTARGARRS